jgi:glutamyl-tRNA synthetase
MIEFFDYDGVDDLVRSYVQEQSVGMGKVMMPLRAALTGTTQAPAVADLMVILGKRRSLARIGRALADITAALPDDKPVKPEDESKREKGASGKAAV